MPSRSSYFPSVVRGKRKKKRHNSCVISALETRSPALFLFWRRILQAAVGLVSAKQRNSRTNAPWRSANPRLMRSACRKLKPKSSIRKRRARPEGEPFALVFSPACQSQEVPQVLVGSHSARPKSKRDTNGQLMDHSQGDQRDNTLQGSGAVAQDRPADGSRWNWSRHPVGRGGGRSQVRQVR